MLLFSICLRYKDFGRDTLAEKIGAYYSSNIYLYHHLCSLALLWLLGGGVFRTLWYRYAGAVVVFSLTLAFAVLFRYVRIRSRTYLPPRS